MRAFACTIALAAGLAGVSCAALAQGFDTCLSGLRQSAVGAGVSAAAFDRHTRGLQPDMAVVGFLDQQPEFSIPIWDYMSGLVDEERVTDGQARLRQWAQVLEQVERRYGVPAPVVVAVWGVESDYGRTFGKRPLLQSLATLSCFGRRQGFFRGEFVSTLKILEQEGVNPERMVGSWAGAFGHTQFMPSTYLRLAVDFDGDGRRDLVDSIPDALASTANFLKRAGWRSGELWGYEVRLPSGFDVSTAGRRNRRALSEWMSRGVRRADGGPLEGPDGGAGLLLPAGAGGPAFLVFRNFDAIYSYNAAESYALAIAHLSDRLSGSKGFAVPWPTDDPGLSRAERRELQTLLLKKGYDVGDADGIIGNNTRRALQSEQQRLGLKPDGRAGKKTLEAMRRLGPG